MDLRWMDASPSAEERAAVDTVLGAPSEHDIPGDPLEEHVVRGGHALAQERRHLLLPALHGVQGAIGWVSQGALNYICRRITVPPAEAYGVVSFYALLSTDARPPRVAHVCDDIACKLKGADELCRTLTERLGPPGSANGQTTWYRSPCLGQCERAPAVLFQLAGEDDWGMAPTSPDAIEKALAGEGNRPAPPSSTPQTAAPRTEGLRLLGRVGVADPESLDDYRSHGGFQGLRHTIELGPAGVIREVKDSKIRGRGGAAFPMGIKWEAVAQAPVRPHYLVCNADESEPGTFKDRVFDGGGPLRGRRVDDDRGLCHRLRDRLPLYTGRVPSRDGTTDSGDRASEESRISRQRHHGRGLSIRHRSSPRRRRLHLWRGNLALQLDRGLPGRAEEQATFSDPGGSCSASRPS